MVSTGEKSRLCHGPPFVIRAASESSPWDGHPPTQKAGGGAQKVDGQRFPGLPEVVRCLLASSRVQGASMAARGRLLDRLPRSSFGGTVIGIVAGAVPNRLDRVEIPVLSGMKLRCICNSQFRVPGTTDSRLEMRPGIIPVSLWKLPHAAPACRVCFPRFCPFAVRRVLAS
ncbi:uncharacterized protein B0I36DRAFT_324325 [Microdochium trichocladiopsis]|uniref:Uncharacterized protein n=1 Tax=Microdochium trichocladiopsis TaxID=1682393 RepID=A0A9P9BR45_9PEZI|nr:uncharacterized protein B0I36DRAFT_324325 [Microdochium trichocladiopsis]KAH7031623.1 hypothetical protein B0I36DRAFT_324325 [Microdochium trichocladiopsis]